VTPIRVSFVIDNLSRAGTESQLLALIRHVDRSAVEPTLVLLDGENEASRSLEPDCPVLRLGVKKLLGLRTVTAAGRLRRFWKTHRPDVVQVYFLDSAYFAVPVAKYCGVRKIVRVRNNLGYWLTRKHRILNRLLAPWVDVTLTNSDAGREALEWEGIRADRIAVIENGVDMSPSPLGGEGLGVRGGTRGNHNSSQTLVVGCVANLRPVKNIDGLIRTAKLVAARFSSVRFEVAGDGPQRAELESLVQSLGLVDRFRFLGSVADVPAFLRSVTVAVLPSHSEGMSNALLEYMATGKAVVATDVGANRAVLGETGVLVSPRNVEVLAAGITELLADPDRTERLGKAAFERVAERYGRAAVCRRFEAFYHELIAAKTDRTVQSARIGVPFLMVGGKNPASPSKTG
jgi:glycosyltransferase involved in cell wall biosynthesis